MHLGHIASSGIAFAVGFAIAAAIATAESSTTPRSCPTTTRNASRNSLNRPRLTLAAHTEGQPTDEQRDSRSTMPPPPNAEVP